MVDIQKYPINLLLISRKYFILLVVREEWSFHWNVDLRVFKGPPKTL